MRQNSLVRDTFGYFRNQKFYMDIIGRGSCKASVFVVTQFIEKLPKGYQIFIDATFKVVPAFCSQLLIIMATSIDFENVSNILLINDLFACFTSNFFHFYRLFQSLSF